MSALLLEAVRADLGVTLKSLNQLWSQVSIVGLVLFLDGS